MKTDILDYVTKQNEQILKLVSNNTSKIEAIASHFQLSWKNTSDQENGT